MHLGQGRINAMIAMIAFCPWKKGDPRLDPLDLAAGLYLTMLTMLMIPDLLPNGNGPCRRMTPRPTCAKRWSPFGSRIGNDPQSALCARGTLTSHLRTGLRDTRHPVHLADLLNHAKICHGTVFVHGLLVQYNFCSLRCASMTHIFSSHNNKSES